MKKHLTKDQLIKYQFKLASTRQSKKTADHLAKCAPCRERLEQIKQKFTALDLLQDQPCATEELISRTITQAAQKPPVKISYFRRPPWIAAAAAVIFLAGGLLFVPSLRRSHTSKSIETAETPATTEKIFAKAEKTPDRLFVVEERSTKEDLPVTDIKRNVEGASAKPDMASHSASDKTAELVTTIPGKPPFAPASNIELVTLPRRENVQITIYNSADLTLVRERRNLTMKKGWNWLQFMWANTLIDPTSLSLEPQKHTDKIHVEQLTFPPRLQQLGRWLIKSQVSGQVPFEITYFTSGINWRAFYMGTLAEDEKTVRLQGYVRVSNNSGEDYENAQTRLIVGKMHLLDEIAQLARREFPYGRKGMGLMDNYYLGDQPWSELEVDKSHPLPMFKGAPSAKLKEIKKEGLSEYFLYTIEGTETIPNGWGKRLPSFEVADIPVESLYKYDEDRWGGETIRFVSFTNDEEHKLGATPIPDGNVKIYRQINDQGNLSYVGGSNIKYIPVDEDVELQLPAAQEVKIEPKLIDLQTENYVFDSRGDINGWDELRHWQVTVNNTRTLPVKVEVTRGFDTAYWTLEITGGEVVYQKHDATRARFTLEVGRRTKQIFTYKVRTYHGKREEAFREPLKIAFVTRTSEIFVSEAEVKNRRRRSFNYVEDDFWPITMLTEIAAVRSKNEFLEVPFSQ